MAVALGENASNKMGGGQRRGRWNFEGGGEEPEGSALKRKLRELGKFSVMSFHFLKRLLERLIYFSRLLGLALHQMKHNVETGLKEIH